jgi:hypothetical protein
MSINEQRIREFAFQIWESEGKPCGQEDRHWQMACKLAEAEAEAKAIGQAAGDEQQAAAPKPRRVNKPKTVPLTEPEQPELLKKPRTTRNSTTKPHKS